MCGSSRSFVVSRFNLRLGYRQVAAMEGYLLPLFIAALALYASTLAGRVLRRLRDLHLLSKLPHPPATSIIQGVDITNPKDFHRTLTHFAGKYGGIYSIRFYHEKVGETPSHARVRHTILIGCRPCRA